MNGLLIAIDGVDGCGKSTLVAALELALTADKVPTSTYVFPSHLGKVGQLIRSVFTKEEHVDISAMLFLLTADAIDWEQDIHKDLEDGKTVIMDRYTVSSSWAYQTEDRSLQDVLNVAGAARITRPDVVFILDVPTDVALARIEARGGRDGLYEQASVAEMERRRNRYVAFQFMNPMNTVLLDGTQPTEDNAKIILQLIKTVTELRKMGKN